mmetsp:Transcript_112631/g.223973  ORF Transcript_112631/g.223973 Transcript_112631/m.223973 type:complete len:311 (-) Transcript_112631:69-1001(-)
MDRQPWWGGVSRPLLNPSDVDPYQPIKPGKLVRSGTVHPRVCLVLSPVDEHIPAAGAEPQDGDSIWMQVRKGPHNMVMFFSCIGFAVPALVHLYMHRCLADYIAAFGLLCVTCTSTLCDVFCIHYGVYDDGQHNINEDGNNNNNDSAASEKSPAGSDIHTFASKSDSSSGSYGKAASAVAMRNSFVQNLIDDTDSPCEVVAPDKWNNFSRILDRSTCVLITAPSLFWWIWCVRPSFSANVKYFFLFGVAFACNLSGQRLRQANPCGFIIEDGKRKVDPDYKLFEGLHATWHFLLIVLFVMSALDRPGQGT